MATNSKTAPAKAAAKTESPEPAARTRVRVSDPNVPPLLMAALPPEKIIVGDGKDERHLRVHVPKSFRLMDDYRHIHHYDQIGEQDMPESHARASYAKANGVRILDDEE